jgi:transposase
MTAPFAIQKINPNQATKVARVDHLPIIAHYLRQLGFVELVNRLVPVNMDVEPGIILLGMVLDTLSGRSPLYLLEDNFADFDKEALFGQVIPAGYFNDDNVGRVMDQIFKVGTQKILSELSMRALKRFPISTRHVHFDTTSVNLFGDYRQAEDEDAAFKITYGYSKDKRPDLKQFVLSLLCVDGDIPIVGKLEDGNASDKKINNQVLGDVARHMKQHGVADDAFIYVADSAMVTKENLAKATAFITRLPANYNECERAILAAIDAEQWTEVGCISSTPGSKNRPNAHYRVHEEEVTLYEKSHRAIVVHSSAHDKRRQKRLERELTASEKEARDQLANINKERFFCRADAEQAALKLMSKTKQYHQLAIEVIECPSYARGRPVKGKIRTAVSMEYGLSATVVEKEKEIARRRQLSGCFVLLSNVESMGDVHYSAERILRTYKDQQGIENNFRFLKDERIVNAIFLNRAERIEVLALVLLIALLIWRLVEHIMRLELKALDETVPGWDNKPTQRPTGYMLTWKFKGIMVLCVEGERRLAKPLPPTQKAFLKILKSARELFFLMI